MGQVFDLALSHSQAWVLLAMADHADHFGERIYPAVARIAWKTGFSERQVQRIVKQLVALGVLVMVEEATGRPGRANLYRLDFSIANLKPAFRYESERGDTLSPVDGGRGDIQAQTGDIHDQRGDIAMSPESPSRIPIENQRENATPPPSSEDEIEDDPEDLWDGKVVSATAYTPRQVGLLRFAASRGATLEATGLGDLRREWLRELESPGLTAEEAEEAFRGAGPNCLPSGFRRFAPSAQERQDRADAHAQKKRDAEYLAQRERERAEWKAHCERVASLRNG